MKFAFVFAFLLSASSSAFASAAYISCFDSKTDLQYPVWANFNMVDNTFEMGYAEVLPNMSLVAKHATAVAQGTVTTDATTTSIVGNAFQMSLKLTTTPSVGRYKGTITGPVGTPDGKVGRVIDYAVDCINL